MEHLSGHSKSHKSRKTASKSEQAGKPRLSALTLDRLPPPDPATAPSATSSEKTEPQTVPTEDPKKQWWYRLPNSKARKIAEKIAVLDAAGHKDEAIARKLGTTANTVRSTRYLARKNGWWDENDEPLDLEAELALNIDRKIVRNVSASLDGQMTNWQTHEMTMAAAKGRGVFKNHETNKSDQQQGMQVVAIQVVMPPIGANDQKVEIPSDLCGGVPAFLDGDVVEPKAIG